jgi:hypothetical protein
VRKYSCDFCGEPIVDEKLMVTLSARGNAYDPDGIWGDPGARYRWVSGDVGYYHATEDQPCWGEMLDRLSLIHSVSSDLGLTAEDLNRREQREQHQWEKNEGQLALERSREFENEWRNMPWETRERVVLAALGDDRASARELATRMNAHLGWSDLLFPPINSAAARSVAMRLLARGELARETTGTRRGRTGLYEWHRKRALEGPILDLERAYNHDEREAA